MLPDWIKALFGSGRSVPERMPAANDAGPDIVEDIRRDVQRDVASGFVPVSEIVESAVAVFEGEADTSFVRETAEVALRDALAAHAVIEATWVGPTDCDRLDAAFADLEADGVISRQNFSCCGTCGSGEIWEEVEAAEKAGKPARGYTFYHMQDTEAATDGQGLYLNYGAREGTEEAAIAIGHEIVGRLNQHGLRSDWDGDIHRRIGVLLDWRRRRSPESGQSIT